MEGERGREGGRGGGEHGKEMREWSKSQNRPNLRDHCIQLTMSEELSWTGTYLKHPGRPQTPSLICDWFFPSYIKTCCKCFFTQEHLLEIAAGWNMKFYLSQEILAGTTLFFFSFSTISNYSEHITKWKFWKISWRKLMWPLLFKLRPLLIPFPPLRAIETSVDLTLVSFINALQQKAVRYWHAHVTFLGSCQACRI